jgi:hypothetical protein
VLPRRAASTDGGPAKTKAPKFAFPLGLRKEVSTLSNSVPNTRVDLDVETAYHHARPRAWRR